MSEIRLSHGPLAPGVAPPSDIYVQVDTSEFEKLFTALAPAKLALAAKRAAIRTREWLLTQMSRELAAANSLPKKGLRGRFRRGPKGDDGQWYSDEAGAAILWIGFNAIEAQRAGTPKQTKKGVRVGKHFFDRAFYAAVFSATKKVWRRKGKGRRPVVKMTVPLNAAMEEMMPRYQAAAARMFSQRLEHEVNYLLGLA